MSFGHLILPLDGSKLAETVFPAAVRLAEALGAQVTLLHILELNPPQEVHGQRHLSSLQEAENYLSDVASREFPEDIPVDSHVHPAEERDLVPELVEQIDKLKGDLVVMCAHGRGTLNMRLFGSIPQNLLAPGIAPVLLIPPVKSSGRQHHFRCNHLFVPIDGNPEHEQGLSAAIRLARSCGSSLHLVMVVYTLSTLPGERAAAGMLLPGATSTLLDLNQKSAKEYLESRKSKVESEGIPVTAEVLRGDPATTIIKAARQQNADLVVMGTHGKSGMDAFWSNSLAAKIAADTHMPLLLVPARGS